MVLPCCVQVATQLPSSDIRALLMDRSPLINTTHVTNGLMVNGRKTNGLTDYNHKRLKGTLASLLQESPLGQQPLLLQGSCLAGAVADQCAPELLQLYAHCLGLQLRHVAEDASVAQDCKWQSKSNSTSQAADAELLDEGVAEAADKAVIEQGLGHDGSHANGMMMDAAMEDMNPDFAHGGNQGFVPQDQVDPLNPNANMEQEGFATESLNPPSSCWQQDESVDQEDSSSSSHATALNGFTPRTKLVLRQLQQALTDERARESAGFKRKRGIATTIGDAAAALPFSSVLEHAAVAQQPGSGKMPHLSRVDASRWFFEVLVLQNRGYITMHQQQPYADVIVQAQPKLFA